MAEVVIHGGYDCVNAVGAAARSLSQITPPALIDLQSGRDYVFCPLSDITPLEVMHCTIVLFSALRAMAGRVEMDWMAYVEQHGLIRHFKDKQHPAA